MNDNIDLSHLINDFTPPAGGAASVRSSATRRRRRMRIAAGGVGAMMAVALSAGTVAALNGGGEQTPASGKAAVQTSALASPSGVDATSTTAVASKPASDIAHQGAATAAGNQQGKSQSAGTATKNSGDKPGSSSVPSRPGLYSAMLTMSQSDLAAARTQENVTLGGGIYGSPDGSALRFILDYKENKSVAVLTTAAGKNAYVTTKMYDNGDFIYSPSQPGYAVDGQTDPYLLVYAVRNPQSNDKPDVKAAWHVDGRSATFSPVDISRVTPAS